MTQMGKRWGVVKVKMEKAFDYFQTSFSIETAKFFEKSK
jgi:hypothetical protein